jgi:hypothetical protein
MYGQQTGVYVDLKASKALPVYQHAIIKQYE